VGDDGVRLGPDRSVGHDELHHEPGHDRAPWRDLPAEFGNWNSVFRQFRRWTASGLWEVMLEALADGGDDADLLRMIDSTSIRAHHCAAGGRGGLIARLLAVRAVASRASSTSAPTRTDCPSPCT
jgi:hypothetical protein